MQNIIYPEGITEHLLRVTFETLPYEVRSKNSFERIMSSDLLRPCLMCKAQLRLRKMEIKKCH